jgi:hypothetical protein
VIKPNILGNDLILNTILFADDQVIVTSTEDELQRAAYTLNNIAVKYNLKISVNKTKAMGMKGKINARTKIVINNNIIEQVNSFNYSIKQQTRIKRNRSNQMCSTIRRTLNNKPRKGKQIKFYKAMAVPTLTYGFEIRTITKNQEANIETAEMTFLRSVAGYKRNGQIRNTKIREELNIFNLNAKIIKPRSQWNYHVQRTEDRRIPKKILTYNPKRKRNTGRPQLRWRDQHTLQEDGTDLE